MNIPPKSLKQQLARSGIQARPASRNALGRPVSRTHPPTERRVPAIKATGNLAETQDVSTDSLPVLEAFQEFLEAERKHARRQVMAVTAFFLVLFIVIAGAGLFFGNAYFNKMQNDISYLQGELNRTKTSLKQETAAMLQGLAQRTDQLSSQMLDGDTLIKRATAEMSSTVSKSLDESLSEMTEIREALLALKEENLNLRHDLARVKATQQRFTAPVMTMPAYTTTPIETSSPAHSVQPPSPSAGNLRNPLEIAILAPGSSEAMKWRIPIAE